MIYFFRYNSLSRLTENDFDGLSKLELLMLHSNGIHRVSDKTFSGLQSLQVRWGEGDGEAEERWNCAMYLPIPMGYIL